MTFDLFRPPVPLHDEWRPIAGWPYEVSGRGQVRRSVGGPGTRANRLLSPWTDSSGYARVELRDHHRRRCVGVHLLVAEVFLGPAPGPTGAGWNQWQVNHRNARTDDNRVENLEWVTHAENCAHAVQNDLYLRGEENPAAILDEDDVQEIRRRLAEGATQRRLAEEFGVSPQTIGHVQHRRTWAHVA